MARDYKHRAGSKNRRNPVSPWLGMTAGLLIGLFVAFLVYIKMLAPGTPTVPVDTVEILPEASTQQDVRNVRKDNSSAIPPPPKPRFIFYSELPEMEVVVPEEEIQARVKQQPAPVSEKTTRTKPASKKPAAATETYYLQAGSFRGAEQADRFKARLAIMGFETDIQTITINNKDTYHRVRVGPFNDLATLDKARSRLGKQGIETRTVKIKS